MYCKKCGHKLSEHSTFCDNCGYKMSGNTIPADTTFNYQNTDVNKKYNRKVLFIVLAVVAVIIIVGALSNSSNNSDSKTEQTSNSSAETWKEFNSIEGNFKALFPIFPSSEDLKDKDAKNILAMKKYSGEQSDGTIYIISFATYSNAVDVSSPRNNLEASMNGELQNLNGKLISSSFSKFKNFDAVDFTILSPKDNVYVKGKDIMVGSSIYELLVAYEQKNTSNAQIDKFVNSFQLTSSTTSVTQSQTTDTNKIDPVIKADYQEGYKAGYVDGRSSKGKLGDNYSEPATEERKNNYFIGYLDGFLKGCKEGNFDCSQVENAINNLGQDNSTDVNLIPPSVN